MFFFFFNDTATTEIYTLSLHDALPIYIGMLGSSRRGAAILTFLTEDGVSDAQLKRVRVPIGLDLGARSAPEIADRKSTRLNSSHLVISYAVFCLKKKKKHKTYKHVVIT